MDENALSLDQHKIAGSFKILPACCAKRARPITVFHVEQDFSISKFQLGGNAKSQPWTEDHLTKADIIAVKVDI